MAEKSETAKAAKAKKVVITASVSQEAAEVIEGWHWDVRMNRADIIIQALTEWAKARNLTPLPAE